MSENGCDRMCSVGVSPMHCGYSRGFSSARRRCYYSGFTLIEMLVATVLSAVLISAVLLMLAGVSRDRKTLSRLNAGQPPLGMVELIRWDASNAKSIFKDRDDSVIVGLNGIDAASLTPNGRLVQVKYQLESQNLWRVQQYLDDPAHPAVWNELVATDVSSFSIDSTSESASQIRLRLNSKSGSVDEKLWIK